MSVLDEKRTKLLFSDEVVARYDQTAGSVRVEAGRCRDCKHWGAVTPGIYGAHRGPQGAPHKICGAVQLLEDGSEPNERGAFTLDGEGYKADL